MTDTSCAAVIKSPGQMSVEEFPIPSIGPEEALLEVEMVGVCSTDGKIYQGDENYASPLIPGHEILGRIEEIGAVALDQYGVTRGDRVIVFPFIRCDACSACRKNKPMFCETRRGYGTFVSCEEPPHLWGGYSKYMFLAPGSTLIPIDDAVRPEAGILVSAVLGNGVRWTAAGRRAPSHEPILIQGAGPQGLAATIAARHAGATPIFVTGIDGDEDRLNLAERYGADETINVSSLERSLADYLEEYLDGRLPPTVLDVTGSPAGLSASLNSVADEGTVVVAGLFGDDVDVPVAFDELLYRDITIRSVFSHRDVHARQAARLIERADDPFSEMVTHTYPLEEAEKAVRVAARLDEDGPDPIKVAIEP